MSAIAALACAAMGLERARLDRLYPPGAEWGAACPEGAKRVASAVLSPEARTSEFLRESIRALEGEGLGPVVGVDFCAGVRQIGSGYSARRRRFCDYVFFDAQGRIVRAYRRLAACSSS